MGYNALSNDMCKDMDRVSDMELAAKASAGDIESFVLLARKYNQRIHGMIFGMTRNLQDADDLTQETFLAAYRSIGGFRGTSAFFTWIYRIAVNLTINHLKKNKREKGRAEFSETEAVSGDGRDPALCPETITGRKALQNILEEAVDGLAVPYKAAFILVVRREMSHAEAARVLGCSEKTVSWRMHKARKMLQARLKSLGVGE